jgi:HEAT repeat protein
VAFFAIALLATTVPSNAATQRKDRNQNWTLRQAIEMLSSRDEKTRSEAFYRILEFQEEAIQPLIAVLRYGGTTIECTNSDSESQSQTSAGKEPRLPRCDSEEVAEAAGQKHQALRWVMGLLGELHAVEAVPELVRQMFVENYDDLCCGREYRSPEIPVLVEIGPAAVPSLIEQLMKVTTNPEIPEFSGFVIDQIIIVLGRIGDERALPILEELRSTAATKRLIDQIDRAIKNIKTNK